MYFQAVSRLVIGAGRVVVPFSVRALSSTAKDVGSHASSVVLYSSPRPLIILTAARLLAAKSAVAGVGAIWTAALAIGGSGTGTGTGGASAAAGISTFLTPPALNPLFIPQASGAVMTFLSESGVSGSSVLVGAFALLSLASGFAARMICRSILVRLESQGGGGGGAGASAGAVTDDALIITAYTPHFFGAGNHVTTFKRSDVLCAVATTTIQSFRVTVGGGGGRVRTFALFPVEPHWRSDDIGALRALVYEQHFRKEEEPGGNVARVAISASTLAAGISGFGPFRPAAFADPLAVAARAALTASSSPDTCYSLPTNVFEAHGTVWARFDSPEALDEASLRHADRRKGEGFTYDTPLPTVPTINCGNNAKVDALPAGKNKKVLTF